MVVLSADAAAGLAVCLDAERRRRTVETALLGEVRPGQTLLVHAGTALALDAR
jgi:hydrogenase maturation factor